VPGPPLVGEDTAGPADASPYLLGNELDGVMNYRFRLAALGFALTAPFTDSSGTIRPLSAAQLDHSLKAMLADYPPAASAVSFNLVDSHDTNRVSFVAGEDGQRLAALLQFTSFGAPMLYYGDEAGIVAPGKDGFSDPYNRAPFPWDNVDESLLEYYAKLIAIRHSHPALRTGSLVTLSAKGDVYAFERIAPPDKPVMVVLNKGSKPATVSLPGNGLFDELNGTRFDGTVPARSGAIVVATT
jgi:glycosidase